MATTITANGINFPDGSAGSPSIGGTDTNTGLFTGSDIVGFATGGSERLRIDASGNVNIANDSGKLQFGTSADLQIYHDGSNSYIKDTGTGNLFVHSNQFDVLNADGSQYLLRSIGGASIELYEAGTKKFETIAAGGKIYNLSGEARLEIQGSEGNGAYLQLNADDGDDNADYWRAYAGTDGTFHIQNYASGSWETNIKAAGNGAAELYYDNSKKFETHDKGTIFTQTSSDEAVGAIKVNTTLDGYGSITVRDHRHIHTSTAALQVENNSNGSNETNLLLRSVNLGTSHWAHGIYAAKSHRFGVESNSTPKVQIDLDGLKFNNDQASANALNDYEEGTWTINTDVGSPNQTFSASYTKIGRSVTVSAYITCPTSSSGNNFRITSLPFTSLGSANYAIGVAYTQVHTTDNVFVQINPGNNDVYVYKRVGNSVTFADLSGAYLLFTCTYFTG